MLSPEEAGLAPNPEYGKGVFRRRIKLLRDNNSVTAQLEDCAHAMQILIRHDGNTITAIDGQVLRAPLNTCSGAPDQLQQFIGLSLQQEVDSLMKRINPSAHCTHLYDMAVMSLAHISSSLPEKQLDIAVYDELDGIIIAEIYSDGGLVHQWQIRDNRIWEPVALQGQPIYKGFIAWVNELLEGDDKACAFALQRGLMVSNTRRWDLSKTYGGRADDFGPGKNICYSYNEQRIHSGTRSHNSIRDFSETPEELLKFR